MAEAGRPRRKKAEGKKADSWRQQGTIFSFGFTEKTIPDGFKAIVRELTSSKKDTCTTPYLTSKKIFLKTNECPILIHKLWE